MTEPGLPRIGLRLSGALDPHACIALAQAAERAGLAGVWFAENPFQRGVLPAASAVAAATQRVGIGVGVVNPYNRHPTLIAMEFAALDELARGRARLGIGSGLRGAAARMGYADNRPLAAVRDAIAIVRAMLKGDEVTYRGRVFSVDRARLGFAAPRPDMPVYMAAMGPQALRLAGRIADGVMLSNLCPPAYTAEAAAIAGKAAAGAARPAPEIVQYVPCAIGPDRNEAIRAAKVAIGSLLIALWPADDAWPTAREAVVRASAIPRGAFAAALNRLRAGEPAAEVLDGRFVDAFAIAGTAEESLGRLRDYRDCGVTELALTFSGPLAAQQIAALGAVLAAA